MRPVFILLLITMTNALAHAKHQINEAEFIGEGVTKSDHDYVELNFNVNSQCYQSPHDAQQATDEVVQQVDDYLQTLKEPNDSHFKVVVNGGYTSKYSRWHRKREICRDTFQKNTSITLKIGANTNFHQSFANIQSYVFKHFAQGFSIAGEGSPLTFVGMSTPQPKITPEHRKELERQALSLAMADAKAKFMAATSSCKKHQWKVLRMSENSSGIRPQSRKYFRMQTMASSDSAAEMAAPVRFDDLQVEKSLQVTFMFEGAMCYEP